MAQWPVGLQRRLAALTTATVCPPPFPAVLLVATLAALGTVPVGLLLLRLLAPQKGVPCCLCLSSPCCGACWAWPRSWAGRPLPKTSHPGAPRPLTAELAVEFAVLNGVAQVFFKVTGVPVRWCWRACCSATPRACTWPWPVPWQALLRRGAGCHTTGPGRRPGRLQRHLSRAGAGAGVLPPTAWPGPLLAAGATSVVQWAYLPHCQAPTCQPLTLPFIGGGLGGVVGQGAAASLTATGETLELGVYDRVRLPLFHCPSSVDCLGSFYILYVTTAIRGCRHETCLACQTLITIAVFQSSSIRRVGTTRVVVCVGDDVIVVLTDSADPRQYIKDAQP